MSPRQIHKTASSSLEVFVVQQSLRASAKTVARTPSTEDRQWDLTGSVARPLEWELCDKSGSLLEGARIELAEYRGTE